MLCLVPWLLASHSVSISRYFATLHWIQYSYHNYIRKVTWCRNFWWFYWSPSSWLNHSSCFFGQVWPPFYSLDYCPHILGMLGTNHSCICHSFLARWSPYPSGCNSTCWNQHFLVPNGTTRYPSPITLGCLLLGPTLWEPNGLVLSPIVSLFGGLPTWAKNCLAFNTHSFKYHANTSLLMCGSKGMCLIINSSYHTCILFILNPLPYNIMYLFWLVTSYNCPSFTVSMWSYIDNLWLICFDALARVSIQHPWCTLDIVITIALYNGAHV